MNFIKRLKLCVRILKAKPGGLMTHANIELPYIGSDEMGQLMADQLREIVLVFCTHGHSGFSASFAAATLGKLLRYQPLAPLTGEDDEWNECGDGVFQNKRASHVFKDFSRFDGKAYDIDAVVFREQNGFCFTGRGSAQIVEFPYTPKTVYVDVDDDGNPLDGWDRNGFCRKWMEQK